MSNEAFKPEKILWVDLEMSGLMPREDVILEVAALVTDWNLDEIASYEGVVCQPEEVLAARMEISKDFWNAHPDAHAALLAQNQHGKSSELIEAELIEFLDNHMTGETKVLLGGNSIHQDRQFIAYWWPNLNKRLHYRMLDVSAWKVVFEGKYSKKFAKPEQHRALEDIRGSIMELKYYLSKVKL